jgi:hypothetical protein
MPCGSAVGSGSFDVGFAIFLSIGVGLVGSYARLGLFLILASTVPFVMGQPSWHPATFLSSMGSDDILGLTPGVLLKVRRTR